MYPTLYAIHKATGAHVAVIKIKRDLGMRYVVVWNDDPEPTVYTASEFTEKFTVI